MKYVYPAIIDIDNDEEVAVGVTFPDIFGAVTCGKDMDEAMFMAKDLLKLMLTECPAQCNDPSSFEKTKSNFPDKQIIMVEVEI